MVCTSRLGMWPSRTLNFAVGLVSAAPVHTLPEVMPILLVSAGFLSHLVFGWDWVK